MENELVSCEKLLSKHTFLIQDIPAASKRLLELVAFSKLPKASPESKPDKSKPDFSRLALDNDLINDSIREDKLAELCPSLCLTPLMPSEGQQLLLNSDSKADDCEVDANSTKFSTECIPIDRSASKLPCSFVCESFLPSSVCVSSRSRELSPLTMSSTNLAATNVESDGTKG